MLFWRREHFLGGRKRWIILPPSRTGYRVLAAAVVNRAAMDLDAAHRARPAAMRDDARDFLARRLAQPDNLWAAILDGLLPPPARLRELLVQPYRHRQLLLSGPAQGLCPTVISVTSGDRSPL